MRRWIVLLAVLVFGLIGARSADAYRGTLTIALVGDFPSMDPHIGSSHIGVMSWKMSYETMIYTESGTGKKIPWLATKWKKLSPTQVKFWIRKGVKFTDGTPLTSESYKYTMSRVMVSPRQRVYFKSFDRIEIIDDHTFI